MVEKSAENVKDPLDTLSVAKQDAFELVAEQKLPDNRTTQLAQKRRRDLSKFTPFT